MSPFLFGIRDSLTEDGRCDSTCGCGGNMEGELHLGGENFTYLCTCKGPSVSPSLSNTHPLCIKHSPPLYQTLTPSISNTHPLYIKHSPPLYQTLTPSISNTHPLYSKHSPSLYQTLTAVCKKNDSLSATRVLLSLARLPLYAAIGAHD